MSLRPVFLLPPKRLLTPRSARRISPTNWGLLPGAPVPTRTGLRRIVELEKENRELRRANEILKAASAFFAREYDPQLPKR